MCWTKGSPPFPDSPPEATSPSALGYWFALTAEVQVTKGTFLGSCLDEQCGEADAVGHGATTRDLTVCGRTDHWNHGGAGGGPSGTREDVTDGGETSGGT